MNETRAGAITKFWIGPAAIALSLILTPAQRTWAGPANGGGGKGVVCRSADGAVKSVEVLDLWEARTLHNQLPHESSGRLEEDVTLALDRLKASYQVALYSSNKSEENLTWYDLLFREMRATADLFLRNDPRVLRLKGVRLKPTGDSLELAEPQDCAIEQLVNYQLSGQQILLNQDLFEKMDTTNQAALIAHEAYYQLLRVYGHDTNSLRARRAIGFVFSGQNKFEPQPQLVYAGKEIIICKTYRPEAAAPPAITSPLESVLIFNKPDFTHVYFMSLSGTNMIGLPKRETPNVVGTTSDPAYLKEIFGGGECLNGRTITWALEGPVEYDREIQLSAMCPSDKKAGRIYFLAVRNPGESQFTTLPMTCSSAR